MNRILGATVLCALASTSCNDAEQAALDSSAGGTTADTTSVTSSDDGRGTGVSAGDATSVADVTSSSEGSSGGGSSTGDDATGASCDVFAQDCPDGYKCSMRLGEGGFSLANVCVPSGEATLGDACTHEGFLSGVDTCDAAGWCFGEASQEGGWDGICRPWCEGSADDPSCEQLGASCFDSIAAPVCAPSCDPLGDDCPEGEACLFRYSTLTFTCYAEGEAAEGESCGPLAACQDGLVCMPSPPAPGCDGEFCCTRYCDVTQSACEPGQACAPLAPGDPDDGDVGACVM